MPKLKVNRKHFISTDNIEKFVIKEKSIWVYRKKGYPKVYKSRESLYTLKNRLVNLGLTIHNFKVENKNDR